MRLKTLTLQGAVAADDDAFAISQSLLPYLEDVDGIAEAQNATEDVALSLEAAAAALDPPRPIVFSSSEDFSGINFEIVGTDENGAPQTVPAFAGPNNGTVATTQLWSSITSITPDDSLAENIEVGWADSPNPVESLALEAAAAAISPPRELTLTSSADLSAITFTIEGRDRWNNRIVETIAGPNSDTVRTKMVFASIERITPDQGSEDTVEVGFPARVCSPWQINGSRYANEQPVANLQAAAVPGEAFGACIVETTNQNVLRIMGEGADVGYDASHDLDAAGDVVNVPGAHFRVVMTATSGAARIHIARPGV